MPTIMNTRANNDPLVQIQKTYETIRDNFSRLIRVASTDEERNQIRDWYSNANDAFWFASNHILNDLNDRVINLTAELSVSNNKLQTDLRDIQNLAQTLEDIKQVVLLAASIAALAV